jgi:hypothetical protein
MCATPAIFMSMRCQAMPIHRSNGHRYDPMDAAAVRARAAFMIAAGLDRNAGGGDVDQSIRQALGTSFRGLPRPRHGLNSPGKRIMVA